LFGVFISTYDAVPFDETCEFDPFLQQKENLQIIKQKDFEIKNKRKCMEILTQVITQPSQIHTSNFQNKTNLEKENINQQQNSENKEKQQNLENKENTNNIGPLTQTFQSLTNSTHPTHVISKKENISQFDLMGMLFKHQMHAQKEEDLEWDKRQKRREENNRRFQELMLNNFKK